MSEKEQAWDESFRRAQVRTKMELYRRMELTPVEVGEVLPRSPRQLKMERGFSGRQAEMFAQGCILLTFLFFGLTLAAQKYGAAEELSFATALAGAGLGIAFMFFLLLSAHLEVRLEQANRTRSVLVPQSVAAAYRAIEKSAATIEAGSYPPEVLASASLSLEETTGHLRLIASYRAGGEQLSTSCLELMEEVYRIAAEMETFLQEERIVNQPPPEVEASSSDDISATGALSRSMQLSFPPQKKPSTLRTDHFHG